MTEARPARDRLAVLACGFVLATCTVYMVPAAALPVMLLLGAMGVAVELRERRRRGAPLAMLVALIVCYLVWVVSALASQGVADVFSYRFLRWHLRGTLGYVPLLALGLAGARFTRGDARRLHRALSIPAAAVALAGLAVLLLGWTAEGFSLTYAATPVRSAHGEDVFYGLMRSHAAAGGVYCTVATVGLAACALADTSRGRFAAEIALFAACTWGLMFTKARGFIGAFAVATAALGGLRLLRKGPGCERSLPTTPAPPKRQLRRCEGAYRVCACLAVVLVTYVATPGLHGRFMATFGFRSGAGDRGATMARATAVDRAVYWRGAWRAFAENPVLGVGLGNYPRALLAAGLRPGWTPENRDEMHAHNSYLHVAAETGLVGLVPFLAFWCLLLRELFRATRRHGRGTLEDAFTHGALAAVAAQLAAALFDHNLWSPQIMLPLMTLASVALCISAEMKAEPGAGPVEAADGAQVGEP